MDGMTSLRLDSLTIGLLPRRFRNRDKGKREGEDNELVPYGEENNPNKVKPKRQRTSTPQVFTAPVLWTADVGADGQAMLVEESRIIVGTNDGRIVYLDMDGVVQKQIQVIHPVGAIFKDGDQTFAWCYPRSKFQPWKGVLYELTDDQPRLTFDVQDFGEALTHACMIDGCLVLADDKGTVGFFGCDGELLWQRDESDGFGGLLAADDEGVFVASKKTLRKFRPSNGDLIWQHDLRGANSRHAGFNHGDLQGDFVYMEGLGKVFEISKKTGFVEREIVPMRHRAGGVTLGNGLLVTGSCPTMLFDLPANDELYRMNFSMRLDEAVSTLHSSGKMISFWDKVYCINLTPAGVHRAVEGRSQRTFEKPWGEETPTFGVADPVLTTEHAAGVVVTVSVVDGRIRARPAEDGYKDEWYVRLPMEWKRPGDTFIVDSLVESKAGKFYKSVGTIRLIRPEPEVFSPTLSPRVKGPAQPELTPIPPPRPSEALKPVEEINLSAGLINVDTPATGKAPKSPRKKSPNPGKATPATPEKMDTSLQRTPNRNKWTPAGTNVTPTNKQNGTMEVPKTPADVEMMSPKETPKGGFPKIITPTSQRVKKSPLKGPSPRKNSPSQK